MAEVNMPRLSDTMQEGTITRWFKQVGDEVKRGDVLAEVETDKANMEVESYDSGILEQVVVQEGETVPIGQVIAIIGSGMGTHKGGQPKVPVAKPAGQTPPVTPASHQGAAVGPLSAFAGISTQQNSVGTNGIFIKASPLARRMAEEHSIDLFQVKGTGPGGRIIRDDIEDFIEQRAISPSAVPQPLPQSVQPVGAAPGIPEVSTADAEIVTLTSMQKAIARRLTESKQTVPHFYIGNEIDMTEVLKLRQELNVTLTEEGIKISVNDLIIKACALALEKFPEVNLGMMDVTDFVAVINPPQAAILAVAATRKTFVPIDDQPVIREIMHVTLSADHRILYGATVARFLKEVKHLLQNPFLLLV